ncbi:MAG: isopentenyl-diphosphate Delta-isomerase [bacterium]
MLTQTMIPAWVDGTLQQVDKLEVHRRGLRHKAVSVFVTQGDHILLQRRALGKYHTPGLWANTCCTHPAWDEAADACARRRLAEELGLAGLAVLHAGQVEYRADVGQGLIEHELVDVFLAPTTIRPQLQPDPAEVADTRWLTVEALQADLETRPEAYTPWLHIYISEHRARIFGT